MEVVPTEAAFALNFPKKSLIDHENNCFALIKKAKLLKCDILYLLVETETKCLIRKSIPNFIDVFLLFLRKVACGDVSLP